MSSLTRRRVLRTVLASTLTGLAGCGRIHRRGKPNPTLDVFLAPEKTDSGWQLQGQVRNTDDTSIHDVRVVAFDIHGNEVCRTAVGDFPQHGRHETTTTVSCDDFPGIVTAMAEESPCDGALIRMLYYTAEQDPETVDDLNHHSFWEGRWRECEEELPPEHVLDEVRQSGAAQ